MAFGLATIHTSLNWLRVVVALVILVAGWPEPAAAQSSADRFQLGGQIASAMSAEFDSTDVGLGGRVAWSPVALLGIEAEVTLYPAAFPDPTAFSRSRWEGLFGVTVGLQFDRVRPFARLRPGFVTFREASEPLACILIFPPPLACTLAAGATLFAFDVGGGVEVLVTRKTFVRVDAGDRLLRYSRPAIVSSTARNDGFFSHDFRFAAGGGLRF